MRGVATCAALACVLVAHAGCATSGSSGAMHGKRESKPVAATPPAAAKRLPPHPVIEAYVSGLAGVLTDEELVALASVSFEDTNGGDVQRLRYLAADHAVRRFLPASLEASGDPALIEYAQRIRALPPLLNPDTDAVANALVAEALRARARVERGLPARPTTRFGSSTIGGATASTANDGAWGAPDEDTASSASAADIESALSAVHGNDPEARAEYASALAEYAETYANVYGVSPLHADSAATAAADAADAALLLADAIKHGADRADMVRMGLELAEQLAESARRRERIPLPKLNAPPAPVPEP